MTIEEILEFILKHPTAPYREAAVLGALDAFARERSKWITPVTDGAGNRIFTIRTSPSAPAKPSIAFTAHTDHPAFVPGPDGRYELLGRVYPAARLAGARICYYRESGEPAGRGVVRSAEESGGRVLVDLAREGGAPEPGDYAAFDFDYLQFEGDRIVGRVCDDLLGVISILATAEQAIERGLDATFLAAFTRAEETGFIGALAMLEENPIPRDVPIVGLECSAARGGNATIGDGPILRVGDFVSTFDPQVTAFLRRCADELAREDRSFRYQRKLMQGGSCESTAYLLDGRRAGGMCLALGNYHNIPDPDPMDASTGVAPEFVSKSDLFLLVNWMVRCVERSAALDDPFRSNRESLRQRLGASRDRLGESRKAFGG
jgi:endoglucanase